MADTQNIDIEQKDTLGAPRRVRTSDPDVFSDPESARIASRRLGCIGIRRYLNRSGGESWMPCTNESDYRKYSGIGVSGRRFRRQQLERDIRQITGRGKLAKKTLEDAVETKASKANNYTKPELRERIKQRIMAGSKGGAPGQWSARKAQMLAQAYKKAGGGYKTGGKSKTQRSLSSWTKQKWRTSDGKKAQRGTYTRRYLPAKAWSKLTPAQRAATNRKKIQGSRDGQQFVPNTAAARAARKRSVRGAKHIAFYDGIQIKVVDGLIEEKALSRRSSRRSLRTPGALRPRLNSAGVDMNPATARDDDLDGLVLEGIPTINRGRGVIDPTPGGRPSRWVPRMRPQRAEVPTPAEQPEPRRQVLQRAERLPKPQAPEVRESKLTWLPEDADKWTEDDAQRLLDIQKSSGLSYNEFAKRNGLFTDDVRESIEKQKSRRKGRLTLFRKNNPKLASVVDKLGAVKDEAMEAVARGKVNDWGSLVAWAFKDRDLKRQRLNDRAINDLFNNVSNGLDPDGKTDVLLGFVPSRTKPGEMTKTFARANNLPDNFVSRYKTPRAAIKPARSITSPAERAERRGTRRVDRISRDINETARAFERLDAVSGRMGSVAGRMSTPSGPDSNWTNQQKAQWKAGQWRKRFLFDEALSTTRVNLSPELQAHIAKYPDVATAARAILDLNDQDLDKLFKSHNDALKAANIKIAPPRKDELPLLPSEVAQAAQLKRPLIRTFLDEYRKMAPNGTLARLDVDTLSNEDIEELFNRYILPEMVDPTKLDDSGVIDVAQRISQPGQENSPLRLLDNLAYMAGDDAMSLEARRRVLQEKLAAGLSQGTMTPAQQQATQNALDAIDEELAKLVADYEAGKPLDASIPLQPFDDPRQMPRWAGGRRALSFEDPVTADDYIMFLLENNDIGFHPEWGPITKPEWENWSEDIQERAQEAERVYREGGELEAKDALDALSAEYQLWTQVGLEAGWIDQDEGDEEEPPEIEPERPIRDEFGVLDEDWVWNTEYGSPEELGVTDDPSTWAQHPDNVEDDGTTLIPLDELEQLILKYAPKQFQADLLEILKPSEWTDPHNGHIDQRYIDLPAELIDYFVGQAMGDMPPMPSSSGQLPTPNLGGIQGDGVGLSDPGGPRLRKGIPFIPRNINWDSALRMFQRIVNKQGRPASAKGSYATASRQFDPALGKYDDWGALQLQNQFVEAAKAARELYVTGTGQDSRKAREQVWNLLQAGRTPQEISHELIIFGADQPDTDRPPQPIDLRDLVKASATQYAIENNIPTSDVTKLLNAADTAFNGDAARQEAFRRSQLERLRDDLNRIFSGQNPQEIIKSIDGLIEETERKKWFADQAYRIERGHDARLRKAALDLAESYPVPTARRAIYMEPDGTITDTPSRRAKALYQEPYTGEVTDDATKGWPAAFDEGYNPTQITRARHANRIYRWWRQNWGYIERDEDGNITREYVGPLQGTLKAHQLHARKYGNEGIAGTTAYATRTADIRVSQLREVKRSLEGARTEARQMGVSGFMRSGGPNLYNDYSRNAARVLVSGRRKNRPSSMLLGYDSDNMPVTRAMRTAFSGGNGKFLSASNEHSFESLMNPENVDYFKHLSPVEKDYFRALYSKPEFIVSVPRDLSAPVPNRRRGVDAVSPDEALINAYRSSMDVTRPSVSGQMGLKRSLANAGKVARLNPERWQRVYLTARNSFRMDKPFSRKEKQNYRLAQVQLQDSIFKPEAGLYLVDQDTGNVIDGPFKSDELGLMAHEKAKGAKNRVLQQNYPRPWEQMPEIQELISHGVGPAMRDFMTLDEPKLSDIRSTVYDTVTGKINERALNLDKGVPQKASDTAIFSRDPDSGELMVLLIQRAFGPHKDDTGAWVLPGGFADPGETSLQTALRELEEEVGLKVSPSDARVKQIGTITAPDWDIRFTKGVEVSGTALFVSPDSAFKAGDDALRAQWFSVKDIAEGKVPIGFGHISWIKHGMALEVDDPSDYGPDYERLTSRLDRVERATRARNKELIEISNSWRKELNKGRAKADRIKLFDEKNLGPYSAWELSPSDDMMKLGSISRMRLRGAQITPEAVLADVEKTRANRLSMVESNFGPSVSGLMGNPSYENINNMHAMGMSSEEIKAQLRKKGLSDEAISREVLYSGIQLAKSSDNVSPAERAMFNDMTSSGGSIRDIAKKNNISFTEAMDLVVKVEDSIAKREPAINSALRKAMITDKYLSGAEKSALIRRLNGASRESVAKFMGMSVERYGEVEASLIDNIKSRNPKMFKSAGAWSSNPESLFADQNIYMRHVHEDQPLSRIASDLGMTEKLVQNIVNRYARWKNSNAPLERAALKQAISQFGSALNPGELQMMRRLSDSEHIFQFAERTNMQTKAALRMYNSAMRKMHMESGVSPSTRNFDANIYKAIPREWVSPSFLFDKGKSNPMRGASGKMSNVAKSANNYNSDNRSYMTSPMSALRETAKDIRQEMRDQIQNVTASSAMMHPVFGGNEGIAKMAALGAYIKRTLEDAALEAVMDAAKKSGSRFSGDRAEVAKQAINNARKNLMQELWMKREMLDFTVGLHDMIEAASWPWKSWTADSPEWERHRNVPELMETYKINTPKGRQAYLNAGFYLPLGNDETFEFINAVEKNNSVSGKMSNPRQWAQSRDLYEILGVSSDATQEELKKAFRAKSRALHPDVNKSPNATQEFQEVGFAWETLSSSRLKREYDRWRADSTPRRNRDTGFGFTRTPRRDAEPDVDVDTDGYGNADLYVADENGRLWPRHNAATDDWPTVPFTSDTVFPQRQMSEQEFNEWSDWTRHGIQPNRPVGSALWGDGRGWSDGGAGGNDDGGDGDGGDGGAPRTASPGEVLRILEEINREMPGLTDQQRRDELARRIRERRNRPDWPPRFSESGVPASGLAQGSVSGRMSSSFPPLDDSVQKRLGLQNLPSSYNKDELTKQYPQLTFDAYKPKPGEPSVEVTTTFGGKANISKYRYDNVYRPIIDALVARVQRPSGGKRKFVSVGGPAGSGKTTDRKTGAHNIPTPDFALHVDADEIKTLLPEARALHAAGNPMWANTVHEESRVIADLALQEAIAQGLDVVYDSTGQYNSGFQTLQSARAAGYDIVMHYNTATPDALAESLERRSLTDPRSLPSHFNSAVMQRNRQIMPSVANAADEFYLWDSTDISSRRLLASKPSASSPLEIKHEDAYVYGDFDEAGQRITRGGRPTARLFQNRYAAESPEGKAIESFDAGQSVEDIADSSGLSKERIFNVVTTGVIDPTMQYRPPVQPSTRPLISPEKKIDDFVSDDALESTWKSLTPAQQSIVKDVLNKKPGAMDAFENEDLPMDIIIWAAQNGGVSGKMSSAGMRQSANNQVISSRERSAARRARELIANNGKHSEIKRAIKEAFTGTIFGTRDYIDRTLTNRGNEFDVFISDVKVTDTVDGEYDKNGYPIPANKTRIEISGRVFPKNLRISAKRNNNDSLASFDRVLYFDKNTAEAEHTGMQVKRQHQGIGIGTAINARAEEIYRELGISEISLYGLNYGPEGLEGADHWARNGYYWYDNDEKTEFLDKLSESVANVFRGRLNNSEKATRDEIRALIEKSRKDKFGQGVTPEELLAWRDDGVMLPDYLRIRYRRVLEPASVSGRMGGSVAGRITQPAEGWESFNSRRQMRNAPKYRGKPWRDVVATLDGIPWPFSTQKKQYPKKGEPGLSYFKGEFPNEPNIWVDCLLWRNEKGELVGILNHYPMNMTLEKKGNFNLFIDPKAKRQGIATALVNEAIKRYNVDLRQQRYSEEGAKFINQFVRRLPENSGGSVSGQMATRYDKDRYSKADVDNAILDVYGRGLQVADALEALRNEYDILMDRTDWSTRMTRLRKAGMLDNYRLPNKKQTARKIKKSLTQKFIDKREKEVMRLASITPPLSNKEILARVNSAMPIPDGVNAFRLTTGAITAIKLKNKKK